MKYLDASELSRLEMQADQWEELKDTYHQPADCTDWTGNNKNNHSNHNNKYNTNNNSSNNNVIIIILTILMTMIQKLSGSWMS